MYPRFDVGTWVFFFGRAKGGRRVPHRGLEFKLVLFGVIDRPGGFATCLTMAQEWAVRPAMWRSYELMSRYVFPGFQQSAISTEASRDWAAENRPEFIAAATSAVMNAVQSHHQEKAEKAKES